MTPVDSPASKRREMRGHAQQKRKAAKGLQSPAKLRHTGSLGGGPLFLFVRQLRRDLDLN
jgi:hypothetical protein